MYTVKVYFAVLYSVFTAVELNRDSHRGGNHVQEGLRFDSGQLPAPKNFNINPYFLSLKRKGGRKKKKGKEMQILAKASCCSTSLFSLFWNKFTSGSMGKRKKREMLVMKMVLLL